MHQLKIHIKLVGISADVSMEANMVSSHLSLKQTNVNLHGVSTDTLSHAKLFRENLWFWMV